MRELENNTHKRYNILTGEWLLVSPHRAKRPWQGQKEVVAITSKNKYEPNCYLCAGNERISGEINPQYTSTFIFDNDFAAFQSNNEEFNFREGLLKATSEKGISKVICFSPNHFESLAEMSEANIAKVVRVWQQEWIELGELDHINYVQIFENKGAVMGCSNSHPHGQIWAQSSVPNEVVKKDHHQLVYSQKKSTGLLKDYLTQELKLNERIIFENDCFVVLVPFWAVWPYETLILPKVAQSHIGLMKEKEIQYFAEAIKVLTAAYDKLFKASFPYSAGIHQAPTDGGNYEYWHWHMSFYPPLLRSSSIKKFMVGYEMFAMPQRDITAESAANTLRKIIKEKHYEH